MRSMGIALPDQGNIGRPFWLKLQPGCQTRQQNNRKPTAHGELTCSRRIARSSNQRQSQRSAVISRDQLKLANDDFFEGTLGHVVHVIGISIVADASVRPNRLQHDSFRRLAQGQDKKDLVLLRNAQ